MGSRVPETTVDDRVGDEGELQNARASLSAAAVADALAADPAK
jgi:hypothetical protein